MGKDHYLAVCMDCFIAKGKERLSAFKVYGRGTQFPPPVWVPRSRL